ncbi:hypothetical protein BHM03_00012254 [Ensete ventricosum]|nr:hypothetical protein BHM03_00012254 [Ensete ventricosum]
MVDFIRVHQFQVVSAEGERRKGRTWGSSVAFPISILAHRLLGASWGESSTIAGRRKQRFFPPHRASHRGFEGKRAVTIDFHRAGRFQVVLAEGERRRGRRKGRTWGSSTALLISILTHGLLGALQGESSVIARRRKRRFLLSTWASRQGFAGRLLFTAWASRGEDAPSPCANRRNVSPRREKERGDASFMPVLVLAARLCPAGVEATLFATLMSISNAGSVTGGLIGAGFTQLLGVTKDSFENLALLVIICNLSSLLPLPLLGLLPEEREESKNVDIEQAKLN